MTITLDDVASLLHLPITGAFHSFETLHVDDVIFLLVELLKVSFEEDKSWDGIMPQGICSSILAVSHISEQM